MACAQCWQSANWLSAHLAVQMSALPSVLHHIYSTRNLFDLRHESVTLNLIYPVSPPPLNDTHNTITLTHLMDYWTLSSELASHQFHPAYELKTDQFHSRTTPMMGLVHALSPSHYWLYESQSHRMWRGQNWIPATASQQTLLNWEPPIVEISVAP